MELYLPIIPKALKNIKPRPWTAKDDNELRIYYKQLPAPEISTKIKRTISSVKNRVHTLGLRKSSNTGQFKPGASPWNKGKKLHNFGGKQTQFKAGDLPHNTLKDGVITQRIDKNGKPYKWIRVALAQWQPLHRYIYTIHHGPIQPGDSD